MKIVILFFILVILLLFFLNSQWFMKILYPQPYEEIVVKAGEKYQIDPYLITAIIRVESKFNAEVVSPKGARGLMQVLPETGRWIAKELNYRDFDADMLFKPEHNIVIGTWYLNYLIKQFNGNVVAAIAAYNGGETNVKKWLRNGTWSGSFNEIKDIPFKETKNYVYKVIMDYKFYLKLYTEK